MINLILKKINITPRDIPNNKIKYYNLHIIKHTNNSLDYLSDRFCNCFLLNTI